MENPGERRGPWRNPGNDGSVENPGERRVRGETLGKEGICREPPGIVATPPTPAAAAAEAGVSTNHTTHRQPARLLVIVIPRRAPGSFSLSRRRRSRTAVRDSWRLCRACRSFSSRVTLIARRRNHRHNRHRAGPPMFLQHPAACARRRRRGGGLGRPQSAAATSD